MRFAVKKFMLSVAVLASLTAAANAADKKGNHHQGNHHQHHKPAQVHQNHQPNFVHLGNFNNKQQLVQTGKFHNYHLNFGVKQQFGYSYKGFNHAHWSHSNWNAKFGCNTYWCPSVASYYYWCAPDHCWYPVSYCPYGKYAW
ncbi:MAG: hypothetical protein JNM56_36715 [Planctomycetia bacterium]|nr:hypothetical protein [Planctomycetia bacterium]